MARLEQLSPEEHAEISQLLGFPPGTTFQYMGMQGYGNQMRHFVADGEGHIYAIAPDRSVYAYDDTMRQHGFNPSWKLIDRRHFEVGPGGKVYHKAMERAQLFHQWTNQGGQLSDADHEKLNDAMHWPKGFRFQGKLGHFHDGRPMYSVKDADGNSYTAVGNQLIGQDRKVYSVGHFDPDTGSRIQDVQPETAADRLNAKEKQKYVVNGQKYDHKTYAKFRASMRERSGAAYVAHEAKREQVPHHLMDRIIELEDKHYRLGNSTPEEQEELANLYEQANLYHDANAAANEILNEGRQGLSPDQQKQVHQAANDAQKAMTKKGMSSSDIFALVSIGLLWYVMNRGRMGMTGTMIAGVLMALYLHNRGGAQEGDEPPQFPDVHTPGEWDALVGRNRRRGAGSAGQPPPGPSTPPPGPNQPGPNQPSPNQPGPNQPSPNQPGTPLPQPGSPPVTPTPGASPVGGTGQAGSGSPQPAPNQPGRPGPQPGPSQTPKPAGSPTPPPPGTPGAQAAQQAAQTQPATPAPASPAAGPVPITQKPTITSDLADVIISIVKSLGKGPNDPDVQELVRQLQGGAPTTTQTAQPTAPATPQATPQAPPVTQAAPATPQATPQAAPTTPATAPTKPPVPRGATGTSDPAKIATTLKKRVPYKAFEKAYPDTWRITNHPDEVASAYEDFLRIMSHVQPTGPGGSLTYQDIQNGAILSKPDDIGTVTAWLRGSRAASAHNELIHNGDYQRFLDEHFPGAKKRIDILGFDDETILNEDFDVPALTDDEEEASPSPAPQVAPTKATPAKPMEFHEEAAQALRGLVGTQNRPDRLGSLDFHNFTLSVRNMLEDVRDKSISLKQAFDALPDPEKANFNRVHAILVNDKRVKDDFAQWASIYLPGLKIAGKAP